MIEIKNFSKKNKFANIVNDFLLNTTAHGPPRIVTSPNNCLKVLWTSFFLASSCVCAYFISSSIINFIDAEVVTTVNTVYELKSQFPTISICSTKTELSSESIIGCKFNSEECFDYFYEFHDKNYGRCFKFNSGVNSTNHTIDLLYSPVGGELYGLILNVYAPTLSHLDYNELAVYFHNSSARASNFNNKGFRISSGSINTFRLDRVHDEKLDQPYNDCYKDIASFEKNQTIVEYFRQNRIGYTHVECIRMCRNLKNLEESNCNCIHNIDSSHECTDHSNTVTRSCYQEYLKKFQKENVLDVCSQYCPQECDSLSFSITVNTEQYPTSGKVNKYYNYSDRFKTYEDLQKHYFTIKAFYQELKYTHIKQTAKFEVEDLISNVGGTLGLFLGISFLSFVELIDSCVQLAIVLVKN